MHYFCHLFPDFLEIGFEDLTDFFVVLVFGIEITENEDDGFLYDCTI